MLVKVLMVEPGAARRASSANSSAVHMSGFFAGAKPSRNQASIRASSCGNCSSASPIEQRQGHPAIGQCQALEPLMDRHVLPQQLIGKGFELWPQCQGPLQIGRAQGVFFDADKMQSGISCRVLLEHLPGTQKIQPGAETGLANHQATALGQRGEAFRQAVLFDEHIAGFVQPRLVGEIHIVEHSRIRATLVVPVELGVGITGFMAGSATARRPF